MTSRQEGLDRALALLRHACALALDEGEGDEGLILAHRLLQVQAALEHAGADPLSPPAGSGRTPADALAGAAAALDGIEEDERDGDLLRARAELAVSQL